MTNSPQSPQVTRAEAATELQRRRRARNSLLHFTNFTFPGYRADPAHDLIAATLERVVVGDIKKLMIFAPPQHGKSELVSVRLPAYWLARRPNDPVMLASYNASLAEKHGGEARAVVESPLFSRLFPNIATTQSSRAKDEWAIDGHRGGMRSSGVGGPLTGYGAGLGIIDDPFENWAEAQSLTVRNSVWGWWKGTFRTRIWEGGAIILVMTRWHEDDLAGRLLSEQAKEWTVLRLPAIAETQEERDQRNKLLNQPIGQPDPLGRAPGEPLAPRRYSAMALAEIRTDVGSLVWNAEYQGAPTAPEGNRFKREWFEIVNESPAVASRVRYWDKAGTDGGGKRTAGVLLARSPDRRIYVESVVFGHWSAHEREKVIKQTAELDREKYGAEVQVWMEQEPGSGGKESAENSVLNLSGFAVHAEAVTGSKDVRLQPFEAQCEAGNVKLVRAAWNAAYIDELCAIPNGAFRDMSDASGGAFNKLPKILTGQLFK